MNIIKRGIVNSIKFYQICLSPLKMRPVCRFYPTCSQYAIEAIEKYGVRKGSLMSVNRILRCNPFCKGGYDPVPDPDLEGFDRRKN